MISRRVFLGQAGEIAALGAVGSAGLSQLAFGTSSKSVSNKPSGLVSTRPPAFDLEVTITGLCLFWSPRSPAAAPTTQHVLMVAPPASVDRHYPRVFYDAAYDSQVVAGTYWRMVPLEETVLDLSGFTGVETTIPTIPKLLDIGPVTQNLSLPDLPDPNAKNALNLACRLTLPPGQVRGGPNDSSEGWSLDGAQEQPLAWRVVWTVHDISGQQLDWKLKALKPGSPVEPLAPLKPVGGVIKMTISNVIRSEAGHVLQEGDPPPPCGTELKHFGAFRRLYGGPGSWPTLKNNANCVPHGKPYSCLPSGGH
jgi:hypothetical protein